jgi:AcrR family transcriptional regulator
VARSASADTIGHDWVIVSERPARTKKAQQSDTTSTALISAARELFAERGFADTSTEQIVHRAGVTRGALYHHYRDKEALYMSGLVCAGLNQAIEAGAIEAQPTEPLAQLLLGAASQAGLALARDKHPRRARATTGASLERLIEGLRRA